MGKVATSPLLPGGTPPVQSGGQNQKWPTSGHGGYITPAAEGVPTTSERGAKSGVSKKARKCNVTLALWGVPSSGDKIKSG